MPTVFRLWLAMSVLAVASSDPGRQQEVRAPVRAPCGGDAALCEWIAKSFGSDAPGLQAIMSDPSVVIVKDSRDEISLMTPAMLVRMPRGATVPSGVVGGTSIFMGGEAVNLPPCQWGESLVVHFLPSKGTLPLKSEVDAAFLAAWDVFSPTFDLTRFPSQTTSGDVVIVRTYSVAASPLSLAESTKQLDAIFTQDGNFIGHEALRASKPCYRESLTYQSGQGVLVVIKKAQAKAFVWQK
jgi:hypothetical protein